MVVFLNSSSSSLYGGAHVCMRDTARFSIGVVAFRNSMSSSLYGGARVCMRDTIHGFLRESLLPDRCLSSFGAFLIGLCVLLPFGWVVTVC